LKTLAQTGFFSAGHSPASVAPGRAVAPLAQTGFFSPGHDPISVAPGRAGRAGMMGTDINAKAVAPGRAGWSFFLLHHSIIP